MRLVKIRHTAKSAPSVQQPGKKSGVVPNIARFRLPLYPVVMGCDTQGSARIAQTTHIHIDEIRETISSQNPAD